ncbi:MAG: ABC transporter substrate-binding protein [Chloroflexi bacterium]|nr:ABC transporter substrate-binding protein [Chloroflexota bacterium]MCL5025999.1 ABC transporter substrate-binding protein [Chloroflexota bacterium]
MRASFYLVIVLIIVLAALGACAPAQPTAAPRPGESPLATAAPTAALPPSAATSVPAATKPPAAPTATPVAKIKRGGTVRIGQQNDIGQMDPQINIDNAAHFHLLYNTLMEARRDPATGKWNILPSLAESWDVQGKTITLKLRKGVKFQDGTTLDAEVVKFNIDRMVTDVKSAAKMFVAPIDSVDVIDPSTVRLNLKYPSAPVIPALTTAGDNRTFIVSKAAVEKWGEEFTRHPVGTGPMTLVDWKPGDQAVLKKWDGYWEKGADGQPLPYLDGAVFRYVVDDSIRFLETRAGNLDAMDTVAPKDLATAKSTTGIVLDEKPWQGTHRQLLFQMSPSSPNSIFRDNKNLRKAVAYALDRDAIAKTIGMGSGKAWTHPLTEQQVGYDPNAPRYNYDPAKAKQLLAEAGLANGVDVSLTVHNRTIDQQQAQMMKQMLDAVGIRTTLDVVERLAWNAKNKAGNTEFATLQSSMQYDPDFRYSVYLTTGGSNNYNSWSNPDFDKCVEEGRSTYDEKQRAETYKRCYMIFFEEAPWLYNWLQVRYDAISDKLKGTVPEWTGFYNFRAAWLDR